MSWFARPSLIQFEQNTFIQSVLVPHFGLYSSVMFFPVELVQNIAEVAVLLIMGQAFAKKRRMIYRGLSGYFKLLAVWWALLPGVLGGGSWVVGYWLLHLVH